MYYKAINSGNANTLSIWEIWNGAAWVAAVSLPTTTDDVYTNNFIVTVTTSQAYNSWNRSSVAAPYNITEGGQFQIDGGNEITIQGNSNGTNVAQTHNNPLSACINRLSTHVNTLHRVGDDVGGSLNYCYGFWNASTYDIDLVGNQQGGSGSNTQGFYNNAAATFISIVGNQQGGSGSNTQGFYNNAAATFTSIVGNQQGGSSTYSYGFCNNAAGSTITFENSFQKADIYQGIRNDGNNTTINFINCRAYANSIYNNKSTTTINFQGITYNDLQNGTMAIKSLGNVNFDLSVFYIGLTPTYTDITLYPASTLENPPAESDVRSGVVYGIGDAYEGTCAVPAASEVVKGVPIDNTIGTWAFDDELILRLSHCATVESTGSQVAGFNCGCE